MAVIAQGVRDGDSFMAEGHCLAVCLWDFIAHRLVEKGWIKEDEYPCTYLTSKASYSF